jgi:hypothetical protein
LLRLDAAVRERGVLAENHQGVAAIAQRAIARVDVGAQIGIGHAFAQRAQHGSIAGDGDVAGVLHERDLGRRFDHATADGHRVGARQLKRRICRAQSLEHGEPDALLDPHGTPTALFEELRQGLIWIVVGFPHAHIGAHGDAIGMPLIGLRNEPRRFARGRQHPRETTIAPQPAASREVEQARPALHHDRAELILAHEAPRLLDAGAPFVI